MAKKSKKGSVDQGMETQHPVVEFIGSDLQPQPDAPRPKTTPYATSPIALRIGPQQTPYYVPQRLLQNPQWIAFENPWGDEIELPDVDEGTGHVLIHYLYTGAYQTLDDIELSPTEAVRVEFRRAVIAYIAAKKYMLLGLQQLAGEQISTFGTEMSIFDVVEAINKDFSRIPDDATWFHKYMGDKVRTAFEQDHAVFAKDDLFSRIDNAALIRILAKVMVEVYSTELSIVLSKKEKPALANSEGCVVRTVVLPSEEPLQVECFSRNQAPTEECPTEVFTTEGVPIKEAPAQEAFIQASPETGMVLLDDGPTVSPSKAPKKKGKKGLATVATKAVGEPKPMPMQPEGELQTSPFVNLVKKKKKKVPGISVEASPAELEPTPQLALEPEPATVKEDNTPQDSGAPAPIKKKKGKKHAIVSIEEETKAEDAPPLPVEYPKPVEAVIKEMPASPTPEPVFEPVPVVEELLAPAVEEPQLELAEHNMDHNEEVPALPPTMPKPEPEPAPIEGLDWDPIPIWAASKKKKKGKKGRVASPPPPPPDEPAIENQDPQDPEPAFTTAIPAESAPMEEISTAQTNVLDPLSSNSPVSPPVGPESPIEAEIGYCPRRAKHIGKSDRWKTCEQCRTFLRHIAVEFVRTGSPIETGYEIVDRSSNGL